MEAVRRPHHSRDLSGPQREAGVVEDLGHGRLGKPAEIAAAPAVGRSAHLPCQLVEGHAGAKLVEHALRLLGSAHHDLQAVHCLRLLERALVGVVEGARLRRRGALLAGLLGDVLGGQHMLAQLVGEQLGVLVRLDQLIAPGRAALARVVGQRLGGALHFSLAHLQAGRLRPLQHDGPIDEPVEQRPREPGHLLRLDLGLALVAQPQPIDLELQPRDRNRRAVHHRRRGRWRRRRRRRAPAGKAHQHEEAERDPRAAASPSSAKLDQQSLREAASTNSRRSSTLPSAASAAAAPSR